MPVDGAFYLYADIRKFSDDSFDFASRLLQEAHVAATPGVDFDPRDGRHFIRFSYAGSQDEMREAVTRIGQWLKQRVSERRHRLRRLLIWACALIALYVALAYVILPLAWSHYEHQPKLAAVPMVTRTAQGIPGDALNVGLVGSRDDVVHAMHAAGWFPADPITLKSSIEIIGSVVLDRPYHTAPVSPLYYQGRKQELAYEKPSGKSADRRHHVRFWHVLEKGEEGRPVWLGSVTFDHGVGLSHYTGAVTHHIAPDIDAERDGLIADVVKADMVEAFVSGHRCGPDAQRPQRRGRPLLHRRRNPFCAPCPRRKENHRAAGRARFTGHRGSEGSALGRGEECVAELMRGPALCDSVMAGLVPAIHVLLSCRRKKDVDARLKAGHDELRVSGRWNSCKTCCR